MNSDPFVDGCLARRRNARRHPPNYRRYQSARRRREAQRLWLDGWDDENQVIRTEHDRAIAAMVLAAGPKPSN